MPLATVITIPGPDGSNPKAETRVSMRTITLLLDTDDKKICRQAAVQSRVKVPNAAAIRKIHQMSEQKLEVFQNEGTQVLIHSSRKPKYDFKPDPHAIMQPPTGEDPEKYVAHTTMEEAGQLLDLAVELGIADNGADYQQEILDAVGKTSTVLDKVTLALVLIDQFDPTTLCAKLRTKYQSNYGTQFFAESVDGTESLDEFRYSRLLLQSLVIVRLSVMEGNTRVYASLILFEDDIDHQFSEHTEEERLQLLDAANKALPMLDKGGCQVSFFCPQASTTNNGFYTRRELLLCKEMSVDVQIGVEDVNPLSLMDRMAVAAEKGALSGDSYLSPWQGDRPPDDFFRDTLEKNYKAVVSTKLGLAPPTGGWKSYVGMNGEVCTAAAHLLAYDILLTDQDYRQDKYDAIPNGRIKNKVLARLILQKRGWVVVEPKKSLRPETVAKYCVLLAAYYTYPLSHCEESASKLFRMFAKEMEEAPEGVQAQVEAMLIFTIRLIDYIVVPSMLLYDAMDTLDERRGSMTKTEALAAGNEMTLQQARSVWKKYCREISVVCSLVRCYTEKIGERNDPYCPLKPSHSDPVLKEFTVLDLCAELASHIVSGEVHLDQTVGSVGNTALLANRDFRYPNFSIDDFTPKFGVNGKEGEHLDFRALTDLFDHHEWCTTLTGVPYPFPDEPPQPGVAAEQDTELESQSTAAVVADNSNLRLYTAKEGTAVHQAAETAQPHNDGANGGTLGHETEAGALGYQVAVLAGPPLEESGPQRSISAVARDVPLAGLCTDSPMPQSASKKTAVVTNEKVNGGSRFNIFASWNFGLGCLGSTGGGDGGKSGTEPQTKGKEPSGVPGEASTDDRDTVEDHDYSAGGDFDEDFEDALQIEGEDSRDDKKPAATLVEGEVAKEAIPEQPTQVTKHQETVVPVAHNQPVADGPETVVDPVVAAPAQNHPSPGVQTEDSPAPLAAAAPTVDSPAAAAPGVQPVDAPAPVAAAAPAVDSPAAALPADAPAPVAESAPADAPAPLAASATGPPPEAAANLANTGTQRAPDARRHSSRPKAPVKKLTYPPTHCQRSGKFGAAVGSKRSGVPAVGVRKRAKREQRDKKCIAGLSDAVAILRQHVGVEGVESAFDDSNELKEFCKNLEVFIKTNGGEAMEE